MKHKRIFYCLIQLLIKLIGLIFVVFMFRLVFVCVNLESLSRNYRFCVDSLSLQMVDD